jgi:hypothetical protein
MCTLLPRAIMTGRTLSYKLEGTPRALPTVASWYKTGTTLAHAAASALWALLVPACACLLGRRASRGFGRAGDNQDEATPDGSVLPARRFWRDRDGGTLRLDDNPPDQARTLTEFERAWRPDAPPEGMLRAYAYWSEDEHQIIGVSF